MNRRVALVQPRLPDRNFIPSLGLLYLAAVLEAEGFEVRIFDENLDEAYCEELVRFRPLVVGFTVVTAAVNRVRRCISELRSRLPDARTVVGGPHASCRPEDLVGPLAADFAFVGEAEYPFLDLCQALVRGSNDYESISNLVQSRNGSLVRNPSRRLLTTEELDRLPLPAFHLLDLERVYPLLTHGLFSRGNRTLPIMTSRGCPYSCSFCCRTMGREMRGRSVENVLAEIEHLIERFELDGIYFEDDNFTFDRERAMRILSGIAARFPMLSIKFANGLRADRVDEGLLKAIKAAGGYWIGFGIESGSRRILKSMRKSLDLNQARRNIEVAKRLGFKVGSNIILGYPGETWRDIAESIGFFFRLNLDSLAIVNLVPFPGTAVHELCYKAGYLTAEASNLDNYYFGLLKVKHLIRTPSLSPVEVQASIWLAYAVLYGTSWKRLKRISETVARKILRR